MVTQSLVTVGIFLALLACLPVALKWIKQRVPGNQADGNAQSRFISALAVGPHERVVTVEVGPQGRRVWLTLGVTAHNISCLHSVVVGGENPPSTVLTMEPSVGPEGREYAGPHSVEGRA